jgi:hypothetical protein
MRKVIFSAMVALSSATMASAQLFVGGSVGFDGSGTTTPIGADKDEEYRGSFAWRVSPTVGYSLSDNFLVGLTLGFGTNAANTSSSRTIGGTTTESSTSTFGWSVAPFARYTALTFGNFGFAAEARVGIVGTSAKSKVAGTSTDDPSTLGFGISVVPVLTYNLSDRVQLFTNLNFLNLYFSHTSSGLPNDDRKTSANTYGLGVDANSLFTLGAISVGAVWRF